MTTVKQSVSWLLSLVLLACNAPVDESSPVDSQPTNPESPQAKPEPQETPTVDVVEVAPKQGLKPIHYWISPNVTHRKEVLEGIAGWQEATKGVRDWVEVEAKSSEVDPANPIANPSPAELAIYEVSSLGQGGALGYVTGSGGLWDNVSGRAMKLYLVNGNYEINPKLVVMHEIGHLFGLTHQDDTMMQDYQSDKMLSADWECPDPVSIDRLQDKLNLSGLHSCEMPAF